MIFVSSSSSAIQATKRRRRANKMATVKKRRAQSALRSGRSAQREASARVRTSRTRFRDSVRRWARLLARDTADVRPPSAPSGDGGRASLRASRGLAHFELPQAPVVRAFRKPPTRRASTHPTGFTRAPPKAPVARSPQ